MLVAQALRVIQAVQTGGSSTPPPPAGHDLFIPTLLEVGGALLLVGVTGFLVHATYKLVSVTRDLARVGSDQWKSNIRPTVRLHLKEGTINDNHHATWKLENACAVAVDALSVQILPCPLETDGAGSYITEDIAGAEDIRDERIGSLGERAETREYHFWHQGQAALRAAVKSRETGARPAENIAAGLIVSVSYTHTITGQTFSYVTRYEITDAGQARLGVRKIGGSKPQIVE